MKYIIDKDVEQKEYVCKGKEANIFEIHYRSDSFGAYGDFGDITIKKFRKDKDIIKLIDDCNNWSQLDEFQVGTAIDPNEGNVKIPFRNDPFADSKSDTHSIIIEGVKKDKPFMNKLTNISSIKIEMLKNSDNKGE